LSKEILATQDEEIHLLSASTDKQTMLILRKLGTDE